MFLKTHLLAFGAMVMACQAFMPVAPLKAQPSAIQRVTFQESSTGLRVPVSTNVLISVGDGENIDNAVKRFKREVNKSGHLFDLRFKRFHETNQEKVKRKAVNARRKARLLRQSMRKGKNNNNAM